MRRITVDAKRRKEIAKTVRRVLVRSVRRVRKQPLGELDKACVDNAADAITMIIILDTGMKYVGKLSPAGEEFYGKTCRLRDAMLAALKIENPYRPSKDKLS